MHAFGLALDIPEKKPAWYEPYFEEECITELGQSYENAVRFKNETLLFIAG